MTFIEPNTAEQIDGSRHCHFPAAKRASGRPGSQKRVIR